MKNEFYLISNIHRSGSSMMMRCFEAGGMDVAHDNSQEYLNTNFDTPGYIPNPNGFYALDEDFAKPGAIDKYPGRTFKFPYEELENLPQADFKRYNLLFMKRDPREIRASQNAFIPDGFWGNHREHLDTYHETIDVLLERLQTRGDFNIVVLNFADVVKNPAVEFSKLVEAGWVFDIEKTVAMVDPALHRFKLEQK